MPLQPNWKLRWSILMVLALPTLLLFGWSILHPAKSVKGKAYAAQSQAIRVKPAITPPPSPSGSWIMQDSGTTASLRGIHSVDGKIGWASGTEGTVLRTTDGGEHWTRCTTPPDATKLDFRGIQAFDSNMAFVLSSGPGDQSRLYKTTDACKTWQLSFQNDDKQGFWDAIQMWTPADGFLAGDPVAGHPFLAEFTPSSGIASTQNILTKVAAKSGSDGAYAASNSSIALGPFREGEGAPREVWFAVGGTAGSRVIHYQHFQGGQPERVATSISDAPMFPSSASGGIFSIALHTETGPFRNVIATRSTLIAVGGDYTKSNEASGTAAWSSDGGKTWHAATTPPHGYRSSVAWSDTLDAWITVGTNGSDISTDDGKTWQRLQDPVMADGNWNALSPPFVVGPKGRIARLTGK